MKWVLRILGAIISVIVLAVCALVIMNLVAGAGRMRVSVTIHKPAEVIWPWLYEPAKLKTWISWLQEIRPTTNEPPQLGQKAVWVMSDENNSGQLMEMHDTVEKVVPNRELSVLITAEEGFQAHASYRLTPKPEGTLVESDGYVEFRNVFARLMTPVIIWQANKKQAADFERLRVNVEAVP